MSRGSAQSPGSLPAFSLEAPAGPLALTPSAFDPPRRASLLASAVAVSTAMTEVMRRVRLFAPAMTTVVFEGATGTGKSFLAAALHEASGRRGPFIDVSAGEIEPGLALDHLFGHARGAFTGAVSRRRGLFAEAEGGTLLIDEFDLLRRSEQAMLLRALERLVYRPVGAERDVPVTCRVVVGVEQNLDTLVAKRRMRQNVRSRLGHCVVRLPTLDERREEIAMHAQQFLAQCPAMTEVSEGPSRFAPDALAMLELASYPANLRDLREAVKAAYLLACGSEITVAQLPAWVQVPLRYDRHMDRATKLRVVEWALRASNGNVVRAAERIGVHRNTVRVLGEELRSARMKESLPAESGC